MSNIQIGVKRVSEKRKSFSEFPESNLLKYITEFLVSENVSFEDIPIIVKEVTSNRKTGPVSATMASQSSCPSRCPWYKSGCYAESGPQGIHTSKMNKSSIVNPKVISYGQAMGILNLSGKHPLRFNIVGDFPNDECVEIIGKAAEEYMNRYNQPIWTYTHALTKRKLWGKVSVLRSCETLEQVKVNKTEGFASALVVEKAEKETAYKLSDEFTGILCPHQSGKVENCKQCKMCWNDQKLLARNLVILFESHGTGKKKMLPVLNPRSNTVS